ncbi:unnamed protein product [Miscanthus lutarioriparius]|uniref:SLC26A/SulP transporter domain-containing protein n=1 Tax=Miscanthus lutarioriparius TaxID=422564 RepID=A0A811MQQ6_9POAL|nr:unnamed protein product [Miscanthus lutarioriparius]
MEFMASKSTYPKGQILQSWCCKVQSLQACEILTNFIGLIFSRALDMQIWLNWILSMVFIQSVVPPRVYAVMGTSREIAIGPVAIVSLLLSSMAQKIADPAIDPAFYRKTVFTVTFFTGIFQFAFGLFSSPGSPSPPSELLSRYRRPVPPGAGGEMQTRHTPQARSAGFAGQLDIVSEELSHTSLPLSLIEMPVKHGHKAAMHSGSSVRVAVLMCSLTEQVNDGYPAKQLGVDDELLCLLPIRAHLGVGDARVGSRVRFSYLSIVTIRRDLLKAYSQCENGSEIINVQNSWLSSNSSVPKPPVNGAEESRQSAQEGSEGDSDDDLPPLEKNLNHLNLDEDEESEEESESGKLMG